MNIRTRAFYVVVLVLAFSLTVIPVANAYIDPGSGSFIVQMAIGALLGFSLAIKVFWRRLVGFFTGRNRKATEQERDKVSR
jgi:hypothetical protein